MKEPSPRNSRLVLAGSLVAAIAIGGAGFVIGRQSAVVSIPVEPPRVASTPVASSASPGGVALDRAGLLALAARAADSAARGQASSAEGHDAVGTRFSMAIPFGCAGPLAVGDDVGTGWRHDAAAGALRLQVAPVRWTPADWWPQASPIGVETIEGFWIPRPWTSGESCPASAEPAAAPGIEAVTLPGQTLAIGQVFTGEGTRSGRRDDKPYMAVLRVASDDLRTDRGFRVRLSGRLAALPGGGAVRCRQPGGAEQRPICLVATTLDEVSVENAATGETVARWPGATATRAE